ncbi:MAG TPA: hypothetical protein VFH70_06575 [Acidimicrobiales bacterium]|nr:hypothetical protein [Acidimicrobiales bacterium]
MTFVPGKAAAVIASMVGVGPYVAATAQSARRRWLPPSAPILSDRTARLKLAVVVSRVPSNAAMTGWRTGNKREILEAFLGQRQVTSGSSAG